MGLRPPALDAWQLGRLGGGQLALLSCTTLGTDPAAALQVDGIPHITIMAPDSTILSVNARAAVGADPQGHKWPWEGAEVPKCVSNATRFGLPGAASS